MNEGGFQIDYLKKTVRVPASAHSPWRLSLAQLMGLVAISAISVYELTRWRWDGPSRIHLAACEHHGRGGALTSSATVGEAQKLLKSRGQFPPQNMLNGLKIDESYSHIVVIERLTGRPQEDADVVNALVAAYLRTKPACDVWCGKFTKLAKPPRRIYSFDGWILRSAVTLYPFLMAGTMLLANRGPEKTARPQVPSPPVAGAGDDPQR